ncbi:MAG: hypothetical protein ACOCRX_07510 [Candidatus Woesearchaeota archaeon]
MVFKYNVSEKNVYFIWIASGKDKEVTKKSCQLLKKGMCIDKLLDIIRKNDL